jgi:polysaccharide export outer membrane protein
MTVQHSPFRRFPAAWSILLFLGLAPLVHAQPTQDAAYLLGPDDQIVIRALDVEEIKEAALRIDFQGYISLPLLGRIKAAGLTSQQLEAELKKRLSKYLIEPDVTIMVMEYRSQPITILGSVEKPGQYQLQGRKTLYEVLSMAGGLRSDASDTITIQRKTEYGRIPLPQARGDVAGAQTIAEVNAKQLLAAKNPQENIVILPYDVISVPKGEIVYVLGEVNKPGGFVLDQGGPISLLEALTMANGPQKLANLKQARILRVVAGTPQRRELPVDLDALMKGKGEDLRLQPEDILYVPHNATRGAIVKAAEIAAGVGTAMVIYRVAYPH